MLFTLIALVILALVVVGVTCWDLQTEEREWTAAIERMRREAEAGNRNG